MTTDHDIRIRDTVKTFYGFKAVVEDLSPDGKVRVFDPERGHYVWVLGKSCEVTARAAERNH